MRILILANNDVGLYKFRKELIERLITDGHEVWLSLPKGNYIHRLINMGCHYVEVKIDRRGVNPWKDFLLCGTYLKTIRKISPKVVLTYTIKPNVYGGLICRLLKISYLANITGLGSSIENPGLIQKIAIALYKMGLKNAQCIFYQNNANKKFMENVGVKGKKSVLLPGSGVNLQHHKFEEFPEDEQKIRFLSIMRIMKEKGIDELLDCSKEIKRRYSNVSFTIVGDYDDFLYKERIEEAQKKGLVTYLGFQEDIHGLMAKHHCIIHPTYHEGMSNVLLEAAACGRPIIASNIPGCKEIFDDKVTGFGFEVKNVKDLILCVDTFVNMPYTEKAIMGKKGREKIDKEFNRSIVIDAYLEELNKI